MQRTIKLKLDVFPADKTSLLETIKVCNIIFNENTKWGLENGTFAKIRVHHGTYYPTREKYPSVPSSIVQGIRDVACEALRAVKLKTLPVRRQCASVRYNKRVVTISIARRFATIATIDGRVKVKFNIPSYYERYFGWNIRTSYLKYHPRSGVFFLLVTMEKEPPEPSGNRVMGIDRGIVNIAVCSNNGFYNSSMVKNTRSKYAYLRAKLQSKGTKSARMLLRKISGKEKRFVTDINHCIAKDVANLPFAVFSLEDLSKIRTKQRRMGKKFNRKLNSWSFYQLAQFLEYKAEALGKRVMYIDARYTSQKCSKCGHTYKGNRKGNDFRCRKCGFQLHADLNAARNIAQAGTSCLGRLPVNQPIVAQVAATSQLL